MYIFNYEVDDKVVAIHDFRNSPVSRGTYGTVIKKAPNTFFGTPKVTVEFDTGLVVECLNYELRRALDYAHLEKTAW